VRVATVGPSLLLSLDAVTDAAGYYDAGPLPDSNYRAKVLELGEFPSVTYPHVTCAAGFAPCVEGEQIAVTAGPPRTGIDFTVSPGASISGGLLGDGGVPVADGGIGVYDHRGFQMHATNTDEAGMFMAGPLPAGRYYLVGNRELDRIIYPDLPCDDARCETRFGQPFEVVGAQAVTGVDIVLPARRPATFRALDENGVPLVSAQWLVVHAQTGYALASTGPFPELSLQPGSYKVAVWAEGYQREGFGGVHLLDERSDELERGATLTVAPGSANEFIFQLDRSAALTYKAIPQPGYPFGCRLWLFPEGEPRDLDHALLRQCAEGFDMRVDVPPGRYRALFEGPRFVGTAGYGALPGDLPCAFDFDQHFCDLDQGPLLEVELGEVLALGEIRLPRLGRVEGNLAIPFGAQARLEVYDVRGEPLWRSMHGAHTYTLNLPPGTYFLALAGEPPVGSQLYPGLPCPPAACDPTAGAPLTVVGGQTLNGIDFAPPAAGPLACGLAEGCLNDARFRVKARWTDSAGQKGEAQLVDPFQEEGDTAFYYFFSTDNVELMVKVLNACYAPFDRFWVFAAGSTNVAVDLEVTDTVTGAVRSYHHPLGQPFVPIQDTDAFLCDGAAPPPASSASPDLAEPEPALAAAALPEAALSETPIASPAPAAAPIHAFCDPFHAICQQQGRFRIDATWQTADATGPAIPDAPDSFNGAFYFFDPDNLELQVKVLDACGINGRYWIFAAGLTNVGVDLVITDTHTGRQKTYRNPLSTPFAPILDTQALACWR
jgi:hypothetical protein